MAVVQVRGMKRTADFSFSWMNKQQTSGVGSCPTFHYQSETN
ncbi:predicted protein [Sclerotinia sclerotiorum 1980 UF-70]|uniref:Uncharacterized protein n=1 Tax=Sclerotinia sclerotiorum (strain ATCC 18683 / 1980 / Ss-1) TaxID=665079 RepID=A7EED9_SCLS1|nr:predicted protein [Sclerotinia sclerotiorum 1980 UF-70]EDO01205.1 predicted protein [Sclerotinia sclerotiorum 1980 UF-70]